MLKTVKVGEMEFEVEHRLTVPLLSLKHKPELYVKMMSVPRETDIEITEGTSRSANSKKEPMKIADVIDLTTGEEGLLICPAILQSTFAKLGEGLVGKCFMLKAGDIVAGKKYRAIDVFQIKEPPAKSVKTK